ncbi:MAG TPA: TolC family protein [Saprospiraceae bacterium]|nr:TolC family protein [Saprospiraceae bacterium]
MKTKEKSSFDWRVRRWFFVASVGVLFVSSLQAQEQSFSLEEAVSYALSHQNAIKTAKLKIEEANQKIIETRAMGIPQVNATFGDNYFLKKSIVLLPESFGMGNPNFNREVSFNQNHNISGTVTASTLLFNWTYLQGLKAAKVYKTYAEVDYQTVRRKAEDDVTNAYLPALLISESEKTIELNIKNLNVLRHETDELFKAGFVEQLDIDRIDLSLANLQVQLDNLNRTKTMALEALKLAMGYPLDQPIELTNSTDDILASIPDELLAENINYLSHPSYRSILATERLNQVNIKAQESAYYPSLTGFVNYQMQWQGDKLKDLFYTPSSVAGFQLNIPIFSGFGTKAKVQQAKLKVLMLQNGKKDMERGLSFQVRNARIAYEKAQSNLTQRNKNLELAQKIYETTKIKYKEGVGSSLEVNQAEMSLYQAQQNIIDGKFDLLQAKIALKQALGK